MLTPTHLAMVLDYEAGGSMAEFVAQQVGRRACNSVLWRAWLHTCSCWLAGGRACWLPWGGQSAGRAAGSAASSGNAAYHHHHTWTCWCLLPPLQIPKVSRLDLVVDEGALSCYFYCRLQLLTGRG